MLERVVGNGSRLQERGIQSVSVYGEMNALGERLGSLVYSASELATGRFSFGVSHSVLLFESGKKIKTQGTITQRCFCLSLFFNIWLYINVLHSEFNF